MKKLLVMAALLLIAGNVLADVLTETFDDPLGGWRDRWLAQNSNMTNYYVCSGGTDQNYRGNNPCGIWICDEVGGNNSVITFDPTFGATVTNFAIGIQAFVDAVYSVYDPSGNLVYSSNLTTNYNSPYGCYCTMFACDTPNGIGRFEITSGSQVEGNMAVDDVTATTGYIPAETGTWGAIKSLYR
jgi:hypothetical protein